MRSDRPICGAMVLGAAVVLLLVCAQAMAQASEPIRLPWTERKPFQYVDGQGRLKGILAELGESIFAKAGVTLQWVETPANRIALELATDKKRICLVGWFRTPEREKVAKVSLPIYRDRPQVAVMRANFRIRGDQGLAAVVSDTSIQLLLKAGYSYGVQLDGLIAARNGDRVESTVADHARMLTMLQRGRADLIFLTQEEVEFYAAQDPRFSSDFKVLPFKEFPAGNLRHILCSKQVSDETMNKLDAAIRATVVLNP